MPTEASTLRAEAISVAARTVRIPEEVARTSASAWRLVCSMWASCARAAAGAIRGLGGRAGMGRGGRGVTEDVVQISSDALALGSHREHGVAALGEAELLLQDLLSDTVADPEGHHQPHDCEPGGDVELD